MQIRFTRAMVAGLVVVLAGCQAIAPPTRRAPPPEIRSLPQPTDERPAETQRVPRRVSFPAEEYAALEKTGTATIRGRLASAGRGETISIAPVTRYSAEAAEAALAGKAVEPADPRAREYTHYARTDANGYFVANGLPAGEYYVAGRAGDRMAIHQVRVHAGQSVEVTLGR